MLPGRLVTFMDDNQKFERLIISFKIISPLLELHVTSVCFMDIRILIIHMFIETTKRCVIWK